MSPKEKDSIACITADRTIDNIQGARSGETWDIATIDLNSWRIRSPGIPGDRALRNIR